VEKALRAIVAPTHQEAGCVRYIIHRGVQDPLQFAVVERWDSNEALQAHLATPYIQSFFKKLPALVDGAPDLSFYESLAEGSSPKGSW
jgi:quinol monooxygenase YgiN